MRVSTILQNVAIVAVCSLMIMLQNSFGLPGLAGKIEHRNAADKTVEMSHSSNNPKLVKGFKIRADRPFADFQREILTDFQN